MTDYLHPLRATEAWIGLLSRILFDGTTAKPRDQETREILGCKTIVDMNYPVVLNKARKLGYHFMAAEAAWIMSGDNRVITIRPYSKEIASFSDDGERFFGAYGPKIIDQLSHVVKTLQADQDSRQAVMTIWRQNPPKSKDIPCTISLQWLIRDGYLHCFANMRSSDVWLGVPYDWFNFTQITLGILLMLKIPGLQLGDLHFYAASQHLYARNVNQAMEVIKNQELAFPETRIQVESFRSYEDLRSYLWDQADGNV